jgi:hypothetical protein
MSSTRLLYASRAAVLVLAIVSAHFALRQLWIMWEHNGSFGIHIDLPTAVVTVLEPQHPPQPGIAVGDRVDLAAMSFRERSYFYEAIWRPAGIRVTVTVERGHSRHTVNLVTADINAPNDETVAVFSYKIVAIIYILVAIVLVWNRPNFMLWGLALFLLQADTYWVTDLSSPALAALVLSSYAVLTGLGWPGLIVFAARFPDDRATRATKYWYLVAAAFFFYYAFLAVHDYIPLFTARPIPDLPDWMSTGVTEGIGVAVLATLCWKLFRSKARSQWRGVRSVVVCYGVSIVLAWNTLPYLLNYVPNDWNWSYWWCTFAQRLFMLAFPASIMYAVLRHRAFGLGYLANLFLVYGTYAVAVGSTIVVGVWTVSNVTSTAVGIGIAMFVALLAGMTLRSSHGSVVRFVDRVFLRHRYEAALSLDALRDTLRGSSDARHLTDEVATTLGLASLAIFSRTADGGFVRKAAFGWPPGSAWHLLPEERLTRTLDDDGAAIVRVPDDRDDEPALPADDARPQFALAVRRGDRIEQAILVGPQRNGASLDRDAMRSLRGVFEEATFA